MPQHIIVIVGGRAVPAPPPPPPPSPPPPVSVCCVDEFTMITMSDGSEKCAVYVEIGDRLRTLNGRGGLVTHIEKVRLGADRKILLIDGVLRISDDHDMWVKSDAYEGWGTHNYPYWKLDAEALGTTNVGAVEITDPAQYLYAHLEGWVQPLVESDVYNHDSEEIIYGFTLDDGAGFFADGFAIISNLCRPDEIEALKWMP